MQKAIIAGSLAVLASGATVPHHRMKSELMTKIRTQMKGMQTQSATNLVSTPTVRTTGAMSSLRGGSRGKRGKGKGKGNRDDDREGGDEDANYGFFEVVFSGSPTCDVHETTFGFTLGQCENYVDQGEDGYALPRSHHFVPGDSESDTLKVEAFHGHGCEGTVQHTENLDPQDVGFPADYVLGTCISANGFYGKASYTAERHQPTYDSITEGYGVSQKSCQADTLFGYETTRVMSGGCMEGEDGEYYKIDLNNCANGVVTVNYYADNTCLDENFSEEQKVGDCPFDLDYFVEDIEEADYSGYFNYASVACSRASTDM